MSQSVPGRGFDETEASKKIYDIARKVVYISVDPVTKIDHWHDAHFTEQVPGRFQTLKYAI